MSRINGLTINDHGFAIAPQSGRSFRVNPSAAVIFRTWQAGKNDKAAALALVESYGIPAATAERDVADLRSCTHQLGLL